MKRKYTVWIRLLLWTAIIFVLCTMPNPEVETPELIPHMDKIAHFGVFFFFSAFTLAWLQENQLFSKTIDVAFTLLLTAFYGALIEWLQGKYFNRSSEFGD